jgi:hypothetical protein
MPEEIKNCQLILRQRPAASPELDELIQSLHADFGLDLYLTRQKLIGPGLTMLNQGRYEACRKMSTLLRLHGFSCWLVESRKPAFNPFLLRSLEIQKDHIQFIGQQQTMRLERGASVAGVLADLSGGLADKQMKRLLAQNSYRGGNALRWFSDDEMIRVILQGQPVFDCYLLGSGRTIESSVRVIPGRFNADGLGARASISSRQNLLAIVNLVMEYAAPFRLHCDFGISQLPNCPISKSPDNSTIADQNLHSLNSYGWLVTQLHGDGRSDMIQRDGSSSGVPVSADAITRDFPDGSQGPMPETVVDAALGLAERASGAKKETGVGIKAPVAKPAGEIQGHSDLPLPPDRPDPGRAWGRSLLAYGGVAAGAAIFAGALDIAFVRQAARYLMTAGIVPALAAVALYWQGVYLIRIKRRVENTPTSKVRSIAMGLVEVHGRAQRRYALVAPMTQSACVWYRLRKYRRGSKNNWKLTSEIDSNHVPFQVDDGTGKVTVDPVGATIQGNVRQTGYPGQSPLTFTVFVNSRDEDEKWVEDIIYEGTSLYVLGYARPLDQDRLSLRERTLLKLRRLKLDHEAMRRYDTDGDGQIDLQEWESARQAVEQEALREQLADSRRRTCQEEHVVIGKSSQWGLPFIIAETVSEGKLTGKYALLSVALLIAGMGACIVAIYQFLDYFGFKL